MSVSTSNYEEFLNTIPDAAILVDSGGTIRLTNNKAEVLFGYTKGEMLGRNVNTLILSKQRETHNGYLSVYMKSPKQRPMHSNQDLFGQHANGSIIPLDIMLEPLQFEGVDYVLSIARDISERFQRQQEIDSIIDTTFDGFWIIDMRGNFLRVNDAYSQMVGYSQNELLNMGIQDVEAIESKTEIKQRIKKIAKSGSDRFETQHRHKNGRLMDLEVSANYLANTDGERIFVFLRDITVRKQAYSEVAHLNSLVLASSSIGFLGYEVESGECVMANEAAAKIVGASTSDLLSQNFRKIQSWKPSGLLDKANVAIKTGNEQIVIAHFTTTFGKEIYLHGSFNTFERLGKTHLLFSYLDVTDRENARLELAEAYEATIKGWSRALELRDPNTSGHTVRVAELTVRLARQFGIDGDELVNVERGALLHDIGKLAIPDRILQKPGPLSESEWVEMRKHTLFALEMLTPISYLRQALDIPASHHERWDGSGYPNGLTGEDIPFAARMFAVVDVWDALNSTRPYRASWPQEKTFKYIKENAGKQFDPAIVKVFLKMILATD